MDDPGSERGGRAATARGLGLLAAVGLVLSGCATPGAADHGPSAISTLRDQGMGGTRWGLLAVTTEGQTVAEVSADDRFIPASNTKIFVTATAFARLGGLDAAGPDGTAVRLEPDGTGGTDVVLVGAGDPQLGDGPTCVETCLSELADAVAGRTRRVGDVIGDDRLYPDERWGLGWSWEDLQTASGTAVSALTVNENVVLAEVAPGEIVGAPVRAAWRPGDDLLVLDNEAVTVAAGDAAASLRLERRPGSDVVRLYGSLPLESSAIALRIRIDDPAEAAALRFRRLLEQRGVAVDGEARARHRPLALSDEAGGGPDAAPGRGADPADEAGVEIGRLSRRPLALSLQRIGKTSQNLHAELMLRRLGLGQGTGSRAQGLAVVEAVLAEAGIPRAAFDLHDGSGLSVYNRVSPRATTTFLLWTMRQPWGAAWRATLPIGGRDGTLARRFVGTPLEGRIFAKTGSLNGVSALAGFLTAASGRTLVFAVYANDRSSAAGPATGTMDRMLVALAAAH